MMTSRSEYRLLHREDNADIRLAAVGHEVGLVSDERYQRVLEKYDRINREIARLEKTFIPPTDELGELLESRGTTMPPSGVSLAALIRRPQLDYGCLAPFDRERPELTRAEAEQVEISIKYRGYIEKQQRQVEEFSRMEARKLPENIDYDAINGVRLEARQKLSQMRPLNIGQASRISGVSPADIAAIMVYLEKK
jgi:tRNA uridine 5-carboxymethylaminomethyl modification enzyme